MFPDIVVAVNLWLYRLIHQAVLVGNFSFILKPCSHCHEFLFDNGLRSVVDFRKCSKLLTVIFNPKSLVIRLSPSTETSAIRKSIRISFFHSPAASCNGFGNPGLLPAIPCAQHLEMSAESLHFPLPAIFLHRLSDYGIIQSIL